MIARVKTDRKSVTSDQIGSLHSLPLSQGWTKAKTSALDWVALFRLPPITSRDALRLRLRRLPARPFHYYKPPTNSTWLSWFRRSEPRTCRLNLTRSTSQLLLRPLHIQSLTSNSQARTHARKHVFVCRTCYALLFTQHSFTANDSLDHNVTGQFCTFNTGNSEPLYTQNAVDIL